MVSVYNQTPWISTRFTLARIADRARSSDFSDSSRRAESTSKFKTFVRTIHLMRGRRGLSTARRREQINRGRQTKSDYYSIPLFTVAQLPMEHLFLSIYRGMPRQEDGRLCSKPICLFCPSRDLMIQEATLFLPAPVFLLSM